MKRRSSCMAGWQACPTWARAKSWRCCQYFAYSALAAARRCWLMATISARWSRSQVSQPASVSGKADDRHCWTASSAPGASQKSRCTQKSSLPAGAMRDARLADFGPVLLAADEQLQPEAMRAGRSVRSQRPAPDRPAAAAECAAKSWLSTGFHGLWPSVLSDGNGFSTTSLSSTNSRAALRERTSSRCLPAGSSTFAWAHRTNGLRAIVDHAVGVVFLRAPRRRPARAA